MTALEGRRSRILAVLLVLLVYLWNLGAYGLIDPDEGRYAEIPREMLESGDLVTPRLNYVKYFEKPVLHYWLTAGSFLVLGRNEFAARLVPVLCGLGGCLLTLFLARRMTGSARAGVLSALVLASSLLWFGVSRLNIIDMTLTFFFTAALFGYGMWSSEPDRSRGRPWLLLFYAGMALATLSKGLIGVVLPGGIAVLHLLFARRWRELPRIFPPSGIALYFALTVPWFWAVCRANPDFFDFFFVREHLMRYLTKVHDRYEPFWFFVPILLAGLVPWTGMLLEALHAARGKWSFLSRDSGRLLGLWVALPFLFFSLSDSKLIPYVAPCMPPLAILIGTALEALSQGRAGAVPMSRRFVILNGMVLLPLASAGVLYPVLSSRPGAGDLLAHTLPALAALLLFWGASLAMHRRRSFSLMPAVLCVLALLNAFAFSRGFEAKARLDSPRDVAALVRERGREGDRIVAYRSLMQGLSFYLGRRIVVAGTLNELEFGAAREEDPQWFIDAAQLRRLWNGPDRVLLVTKPRHAGLLASDLGREPVRLGETPGGVLFANF
ncbi:phospholipid carrier-dependent glycosyltransferase [Fretibacterium sp. OH1220_COT-178]|uniref:phospholipid carrier-dependent glycosyltransferase n=1 Tax=Fretibacterium sp. OH1220_COT-178 TaxID=2491047 RepID=UPI000F5FB3C2|nr:phospholipid carrier-dependent glycosyltransferase [Fretibacterium sp. OH1220_COT-178]RRD65382.1 phospholipid carrier-dependent glycosyltransferase [Fretibacterium sp. OH1220_COT-178]